MAKNKSKGDKQQARREALATAFLANAPTTPEQQLAHITHRLDEAYLATTGDTPENLAQHKINLWGYKDTATHLHKALQARSEFLFKNMFVGVHVEALLSHYQVYLYAWLSEHGSFKNEKQFQRKLEELEASFATHLPTAP